MTNSLVGDHQVAVVDVDQGPEVGKSLDFFNFPTILLYIYIKHCPKNHEDSTTLSKKFPTPRQDTLSASNSYVVAPPFAILDARESL